MGLFGGKKSQSWEVAHLLEMSDQQLNKLLKGQKEIPYRSAKDLRKAAKADRRRVEGEKGMGALLDGLKGGGSGNRRYQDIPLKDRVHPSEYRRILDREARRQGLL